MKALNRNLIGFFVIVLSLLSFSIDFSSDDFILFMPGWYEIFFSVMAAALVRKIKKWNMTESLISIVYATFLLIGRAFFKYEWDERIPIGHGEQIYKWIIALPGFFLVSSSFVHFIFECVYRDGRKWVNSTDTIWMDRHSLFYPFLMAMLLQAVSYVCCFPGIMIPGDNPAQLYQFTRTFIDGEFFLTNHHPILHTILLGCFVWGGKLLFNSETIGYGLYTGVQLTVYTLCFAYMICFLKKNEIQARIRIGLILFYGIIPIFSNIMIVSTKDMWYVSFLLLFMVEMTKELQNKGNILLLMLTGILCILSRNEGIYVVLIPLLTLMLLRHHRACGIIVSAIIVSVHVLTINIIFPIVHVSLGSYREALSIPMQTMARYVIGHYGEWSEEEEKIISNVLAVEHIEEWYSPNSVDPIKVISTDHAKSELTKEDVKQFLQVWIKLGIRHPLTYFDAILEMKNQYLYPTNITGITDGNPNQLTTDNSNYSFSSLRNCYLNIYYPESLKTVRIIFEKIRNITYMLPVIRVFCIAPTYTWLSLLVICYFIKQRSLKTFPMTFMLMGMIMVLFATPLDGYDFRYSLPVAHVLVFGGLLNLKLLYPQE